ncbi:MAG: peptidylprolyl isomerase [Bacteroidota bacterium]
MISCSANNASGDEEEKPKSVELAEDDPKANKKDFVVTIKTSFGDMHAILYDQTPVHKENFIKLAKEGRFDSTTFHRVINEFMIQGGDIDAKEGVFPPSTNTLPAEFDSSRFHKKGALAAARQDESINPEMASSWCQFYIVQGKKYTEEELTIDMAALNQAVGQYIQKTNNRELGLELQELYQQRKFEDFQNRLISLKPICEQELGISLSKEIPAKRMQAYTTIGGVPHLDDTYTVFGEVIDGIDIVDKIAEQRTSRGDKPVEDIFLTVEVQEMTRRKIAKRFGYVYP